MRLNFGVLSQGLVRTFDHFAFTYRNRKIGVILIPNLLSSP